MEHQPTTSKTNFFRLLAVLFFISLAGCQKDNVELSQNTLFEQGHNPFFKTGKISEFQKLSSYLKRFDRDASYFNRSAMEDAYRFTILETHDIFVYTGTASTSYTLPIKKDNEPYNTYYNWSFILRRMVQQKPL